MKRWPQPFEYREIRHLIGIRFRAVFSTPVSRSDLLALSSVQRFIVVYQYYLDVTHAPISRWALRTLGYF
jgi:hypothetical protein